MKIKMICFVLSLIIWCSASTTVCSKAQTQNDDGTLNVYHSESAEYFFQVLEYKGDNHQIVRIYNKPHQNAVETRGNSTDMAGVETEKAKAILRALGIDAEYIDSISEEQLREYGRCEQITTTASYIKRDMDGNVTYLSEELALAEVAEQSQKPEETYDERVATEYLSVTHSVFYYGEARYKFITSAHWLTMPSWRLTDSIGSCAQNISLIYGTASGQYGFDSTLRNSATNTTLTESYRYEITDIYQATPTGVWEGMIGCFDLPIDYSDTYTSIRHQNFWALFEFQALVSSPEEIHNFNSIGCYCHHQILPILNPSATISMGSGNMDIGISLGVDNDVLSAKMTLKYYP